MESADEERLVPFSIELKYTIVIFFPMLTLHKVTFRLLAWLSVEEV